MKKKLIMGVILSIGTILTGCSSEEATYPTKPIEIIVPFGAGGGADVSVRLLAKYAEEALGQRIIITNVTGGSGTIGITQLANAKADGYKVGYIGTTNTNDSLLFQGITYGIDSFEPIFQYAADPHIIVASKDSGITSMEQLLETVKANPEAISIGIGGAWSSHDLLRISLEELMGTNFKRMVFQSGADAINSVAAGDCMVAVPFVSEALAQIEAGNVIPLAITSAERYSLSPDVPTAIEEGIDFTHTMWRGIVAPAGIPEEVETTLSTAFKSAFDNLEFQAEAEAAGVFLQYLDGAAFDTFYLENHEEIKGMIE
ncbi:hypothetical protein AN639_00305 [Candidatus Epulonipiscium fishelsonii]|uniref:Uncharacterized protein n=1 Tax=Candidatus Epulonipiscium fishelsonii TaxID=77094 RepID=A0ACC8XCG1_9FIRM|nr:hypothetical protein AN396_05470 [Epulopiscium sp. SCG-B11WGA-EpuloA1]ONI41827.1 hypothetical protein AN639_00305 [Epulopiscium sp. SCG-B05WGA-EpuloA1]